MKSKRKGERKSKDLTSLMCCRDYFLFPCSYFLELAKCTLGEKLRSEEIESLRPERLFPVSLLLSP